jgi:valyl-tRNA synthetase
LKNGQSQTKSSATKPLEEEFEIMLDCVSLVYSARQSAKLKRRWPLRKMLVVAPEKTCKALQSLNEVLLELSNVKEVEFAEKLPEEVKAEISMGKWVEASEKGISVYLEVYRDEKLLGEGLMRDIARRVQSLRKELGYVPTDILNSVHIAGLDEESIRLIQSYLVEMAELVRAKAVHLNRSRDEVKAEWREYPLDEKKIYIAIL